MFDRLQQIIAITMCVHVGLWGTFIFGVSMNILFAFASSLIVLKYVYMCCIFMGIFDQV